MSAADLMADLEMLRILGWDLGGVTVQFKMMIIRAASEDRQ